MRAFDGLISFAKLLSALSVLAGTVMAIVFLFFPPYDLSIRILDDRSNRIAMEHRLETGAGFKIQVSASHSVYCYLYILETDSEDQVAASVRYRLHPSENRLLPDPEQFFKLSGTPGRERLYLVFSREIEGVLEDAEPAEAVARILDLAHSRSFLNRLLTVMGIRASDVFPLSGDDRFTCWLGGPCVYNFAIVHEEGAG